MKPVVVTALALLLLLFLWPMVFLGGPTPAPEESESLPTATLPIDRAAVRRRRSGRERATERRWCG